MTRIIGRRKIWFTFSGVLLAASVTFLALGGLKLGMDFTGGSLLHVSMPSAPSVQEVEAAARAAGFSDVRVQATDDDGVLLRTKEVDEEHHASLIAALHEKFGEVNEQSFSTVGSTLGAELRQRSVVAILLVLFGIVVYLAWAFRKASGMFSAWAFGVNAIVALVHDLIITVGAFAVLGFFAGVEVDALFVTALLTVLGFSVHDTIVVFDRVRERLRHDRQLPLQDILDRSVNDTIVRSINTSLTTLLVLFALLLFGGSGIHSFVLALIIGISIGTYSSIFIASPLLLSWSRRR